MWLCVIPLDPQHFVIIIVSFVYVARTFSWLTLFSAPPPPAYSHHPSSKKGCCWQVPLSNVCWQISSPIYYHLLWYLTCSTKQQQQQQPLYRENSFGIYVYGKEKRKQKPMSQMTLYSFFLKPNSTIGEINNYYFILLVESFFFFFPHILFSFTTHTPPFALNIYKKIHTLNFLDISIPSHFLSLCV